MVSCLKVILVGVDGATSWIIEELLFGLSGFNRLAKDGILCNLKTTLPPLSSCAWASIYTGVKPSRHGMFDFVGVEHDYNVRGLGFVNGLKFPVFWSLLGKFGFKSVVVNPPMVYPAFKVNGVLVSGWPSPRVSVYPDRFRRVLKEVGYKIDVDGLEGRFRKDPDATVDDLVETAKTRGEACLRLAEEVGDWNLLFPVFTVCDRIQHFALGRKEWKKWVLKAYRVVDEFIQQALNLLKEEEGLLFVVSDHGFQPIRKSFLINSWLVKTGFAKLRYSRFRSLIREYIVNNINLRTIYWGASNRRLATLVGKIGSLFLGGAPLHGRFSVNDFILRKTLAFASGTISPTTFIWINDERFKQFAVEKSKKSDIREKIVDGLFKVKDQSGIAIVRDVVEVENLYTGNGKGDMVSPDLMVVANDGYTIDPWYVSSGYVVNPSVYRHGDHSFEGVFAALGPSLNDMKNFNTCGVVDIAPTILSLFKIPIPSWMSGEPLTRINSHSEANLKNRLKLKAKIVEKKLYGC
jgi:predicted AlkP superfamily phosphohydrolase/phosphomutase